jgi:hypothetical protein
MLFKAVSRSVRLFPNQFKVAEQQFEQLCGIAAKYL